MNETNDGSNSDVPRKKSKKHKKHKKSKKAAITLDEFLNMNQDVFGEGIDFHGIEEVPEQVVNKQLKGRKAPLKPKKTRPKMLSTDIAKLKKQGIVVKMKSGKNINQVSGVLKKGTAVKVTPSLLPNKNVTQTKAITSDEVLSKLLNQGNSQIKVVKRSVQDKPVSELQYPSEELPMVNKDKEDISDEKEEEKEMEETSNVKNDIGDNHEEHVDSLVSKRLSLGDSHNPSFTRDNATNDKLTNEQSSPNKDLSNKYEPPTCDSVKNKPEKKDGNENLKDKSKLETGKTNVTNPLNALRNINQHLTIKSLTSSNNVESQQKRNLQDDVDNYPESDRDNGECNKAEQEIKTVDVKSFPDKNENNSNKNSLNALKHLSHLITIKSVNKNAPVAQNDTIKEKTDIQDIPPNKDGDNSKKGSTEQLKIPNLVIKKGNPIVREQPQDKEIPKSVDAFKNISKHITIKTMTPKIESVDGKRLEDTHDDCDEDIDLNFKTSEQDTDQFSGITKLTSGPLATKSVLYLKSPEIRTQSTSPSQDTDKFMGIKTNTKITSSPLTTKSVFNLKSPEIRPQSISPSPKINRPATGNEPQTSDKQLYLKDETDANKESCSNILKHLPNLTTKQLNVTKNISQNVTVQSATQSMNFLKGNIIKKSVTKEMNEDIEIFNIDDSDDEQDNSQNSSTIQTSVKPPIDTLRNVVKNDTQKSRDALKNLSKAITVKSTNQQNLLPNAKDSNLDDDVSDDYDVYSNPSDHESDTNITKQLDLIKTAGPVNDASKKIGNTNINKPMDSLKTLSKNITIKSSNKQKLPVSKNVPSPEDMLDNYDVHSNYSDVEVDDANNTLKQNIKKPMLSNLMVSANSDNGSRNTNMKKSMDALKNLSKHMTIKSSNQQKLLMNENVSSLEDKLDDHDSNNSDDDGINNTHQLKPFKNMSDAVKITSKNEAKNSVDKSKEALKNLSKHITIKSTNQQKIPLNKSVQDSDDMIDKIDFDPHSNYSDDDVDVTKNTIKKHVQKQSQQKNMIGTIIKTSQNYSKSEVHKTDSYKHLSKHITVKSSNQQKLIINKNVSCTEATPDFNAYSNDSDNEVTMKPERQNAMLQQKLKSLSKNITVKSRNSSPKTNVKSQSTQGFKHNLLDGYDSDSNSCPGNVNITELTDDNINNAEALSQLNNTENCQSDINCIVQSPSGSNSDNDDQKQFSDIESQIKSHIVKNPPTDTSRLNKQSDYLDSLKNIRKHITVKSRKENNLYEENESECDMPADSHPNKELSIKPFKQIRPGCRDDNETFTSRTINQSSTNQKNFTSDQVNTVNKEVTVKTFQTKTYIEEVTTTVTKTIRTVNQTVKQEVRNTSQASSVPMIKPQRLPGIRPNLQTKNLQGTPVRQAMPTMGPRVRNPVPPMRPAIGARGIRPTNQVNPVRPSNQLVPLRLPNQLVPTRPGLNVVRPNNPRMPMMKKVPAPTSTPQNPVVGKPLKISPHAKMQPTKRPAEDSTGHFSCFKKPKESLIPVSDVPLFNSQQDRGMAVHYASSSNMSKSNFTSTTKVVKGNSVVTSTQVKSEVSANSEQLSRLSNMSGLKIMKTSQNKQASHVEEKCEISASKRNALEAIQKLQKSGLLVKKPRLEDRFSDHSNSDVDDNFET